MIDLKKESVASLAGVGPKTRSALESAGIFSFYDLLCRFPRRYEDHTPKFSLLDTSPDTPAAFVLKITSAARIGYTPTKKKIVRFSARLSEHEPLIHIAFFNQTYLASTFRVGDDWLFYGKVVKSGSGYYMFSPSYEKPSEVYSSAVPVYPQTAGLGKSKLAKLITACLDRIASEEVEETLPRALLLEQGLPDVKTAFFEIHRPQSRQGAEHAVSRFAFEELFNFALASIKLAEREDTALVKPMKKVDLTEFYSALPFELTGAQKRVISEIENDLTKGADGKMRAMRRLVQGDVGSGKTAVAAAAMYMCARNGAKSIIMAPTEILACQHYATLSKFLSPLGIPVYLLTGSTTRSERLAIEKELLADPPLVLVGTHALFESGLGAVSIGLVVTDEQHRFGVAQREKLLSMADFPNSLVMSATPIPRTLAMFLYAGLDISKLDELPKGRRKTETYLIPPSKKERMYSFIKKQLEAGHQGYVICPLVEEMDEEELSEADSLVSAESAACELSEKLAPYKVGLLHGKMKSAQKNEIMSDFASGKIDVLVSTTVVEVGVDVPNATVMAIENAERFGLAQLHQLRGRVGRGNTDSQCILITPTTSRDALERLSFMCQTSDGFKIAEYDLERRGPGDFFGHRQHGELPFTFATISRDATLFEKAMAAAKKYKNKKEL